jgi:aldose 1-epimerase
LHGGIKGFNAHNFSVTSVNEDKNSIEFCLFSPNGDEGFTGNMFLYVTYTLDGSSLDIEYSAKCDENTVCNLTNHSYFNLSGAGEKIALDTYLKIDADNFTPLDNDLVTTGEILSVSDTPFDFKEFKKIDRDIECDNAQLKIMGGYDVNFCLNNGGIYKKVISAYNENSGITLDVYTDRIGVQLYSGNFLSGVNGKGGATYPKRSGFCLETQTYPGALNNPNFPSVILKANEKYFAKTTYKFGLL